jgi:Zn-finger nucleic acid-binding protein
MSMPDPTCPRCHATLVLQSQGDLDLWACPNGHGLAFTLTEAYGRVQDDEIRALWAASDGADVGATACPFCTRPMRVVTIGVDSDEAFEGEPGDGPDEARVTLDVCREDQVFWFDPGELESLPLDLPNPGLTSQQQANLEKIRAEFDAALDEGIAQDRGFLDAWADRMTGRHPGLTRMLQRSMTRGAR